MGQSKPQEDVISDSCFYTLLRVGAATAICGVLLILVVAVLNWYFLFGIPIP